MILKFTEKMKSIFYLWVNSGYINLTKKEKICAHSFGYGAKFCEQYGSDELGKAIMLLIASSKCNGSGGGDFPELDNLGRWAGDRIAFVGDFLCGYKNTLDNCDFIFGYLHSNPFGS